MRHGEHGRTSKALRRFPKLSLQLLRFSTTRLSKSSSDKRFAACLASASSTLIGPTGVMHALMQLPRLTDAPLLCLDLLHNPSGFYLECRRFNTRTGAKTSSLRQKPLQLHVLASNAVGGLTSFPFTVFRSRHTFLSNHALKRACGNSTRSLTGGSEGAAAASSDIAYQKCRKRSQKTAPNHRGAKRASAVTIQLRYIALCQHYFCITRDAA